MLIFLKCFYWFLKRGRERYRNTYDRETSLICLLPPTSSPLGSSPSQSTCLGWELKQWSWNSITEPSWRGRLLIFFCLSRQFIWLNLSHKFQLAFFGLWFQCLFSFQCCSDCSAYALPIGHSGTCVVVSPVLQVKVCGMLLGSDSCMSSLWVSPGLHKKYYAIALPSSSLFHICLVLFLFLQVNIWVLFDQFCGTLSSIISIL